MSLFTHLSPPAARRLRRLVHLLTPEEQTHFLIGDAGLRNNAYSSNDYDPETLGRILAAPTVVLIEESSCDEAFLRFFTSREEACAQIEGPHGYWCPAAILDLETGERLSVVPKLTVTCGNVVASLTTDGYEETKHLIDGRLVDGEVVVGWLRERDECIQRLKAEVVALRHAVGSSAGPLRNYQRPIEEDTPGELMLVEEFLDGVTDRLLTDYDGYGYPARDNLYDDQITIRPSSAAYDLPIDATHVLWLNR